MTGFVIGERVRWVRAVTQPQYKNAEGVITAVIPNNTLVNELTMYDVKFDFGLFTLYGTQLEPAKVQAK